MMNTPSIMHYRKSDAPIRSRLWCFPYAGGGASAYRNWIDQLPSGIEICAIQYPGRENRLHEQPYLRLNPLVQTIVTEMRPYLDLPCTFFGHSMGALISFEVARYLRKQNFSQPKLLCVSAGDAPQTQSNHSLIHQLPDLAFIEELRRYDGTPEIILQDPELQALFFPILRADLQLLDAYEYTDEEPLSYPIRAFGGENDKRIDYAHLVAWNVQTTSSFAIHTFPGGHFYLNSHRSAFLNVLFEEIKLNLVDAPF